MFLVSDAGKTRFAAKEAFIVYTQGSCKAKLGAGSAKIRDIAYWYGIDLESISYRSINTSIDTA